jgi:hypothetical protein
MSSSVQFSSVQLSFIASTTGSYKLCKKQKTKNNHQKSNRIKKKIKILQKREIILPLLFAS